ncbi:MAG: aminopeptidase, partial [Bacillota bacterium]
GEAATLGELGIGTNDGAVVTGNVLEDEKVLGTVHVAFGDNASMGGRVAVPIHVDGVILAATLLLDGQVVVQDGRLLGLPAAP